MANFYNIYPVELQDGPAIVAINALYLGNVKANRIGARVTLNGAPFTLGGSCAGTVIRADGATIAVSGTVADNVCYIDLPNTAYAIAGPLQIFVTNTSGSVTTTLVAAFGNVVNTETGAIAPGTIPDTVDQLIAEIEAAVATIPADYSSLWQTFAAPFSTSTVYHIGDIVTYDGKLYKFTADHAAGSWSTNQVTQITVGSEITPLIKGAEIAVEQRNVNVYLWEKAFNHGKNHFNYQAIFPGSVVTTTGVLLQNAGYTSDFIAVKPSTTYHKRYVFGSQTVADAVFYNSSYEQLSLSCGTNGTITTPANCYYVKLCGYTAQAAGEMFEEGSSFTAHEYYRPVISPETGGGQSAFIFSVFKIIYDSTNKKLVAINSDPETGYFRLLVPGYGVKHFTTPVSVSGTFSSSMLLYYNLSDDSFVFANSGAIYSENLYLIQTTLEDEQLTLRGDMSGLFIISSDPVLNIDMVAGVIHVVVGANTYLWYKQAYQAMTQETYDVPLAKTGINLVFFNPVTKKFGVSNTFLTARATPDLVPCGVIYASDIDLLVPYKVTAVDRKLQGKKVLTYGDSLTWYDMNAFTWGAHQGETCYGYQSYLRQYLGASTTNKGASGKTTPQIAEIILADSATITGKDYVIFMPSIDNDDRLSVSPGTVQPIGGTFDTTTTAGAMQSAIEYIYSINPAVRLVIMVEPRGWTYTNGAPKLCSELLPIVIRNVAALYGIPIIDLWEKSGINELTRNTFLADPTFESGDNTLYMYHPNNDGWARLSRIICAEMAGL